MSIVLSQKDENYIESLRIFNGMIDKKPEKVFICKEEKEIITAIDYARLNAKTISVLGSGHNVSGRAIMGDVVISVRNMQNIQVIQNDLIAICDPGVTMSILDRNTFIHGLVCTGGTVSSTGISGLTLGGGIGWLHGNLGSSSDNVKEFEILNYLGNKIVCNDKENKELFWVMRGAGFGIGVVTKITYQLHQIRKFAAYNCLLNINLFDKVKSLYLQTTKKCSKRLTFFLSFLTSENNNKMISLEISFSNFENANSDEFDTLIRKINCEYKNEIINEKTFNDYIEFQSYFDNDKKYGMRSYWKSLIKEELSVIDWETIRNGINKAPSKYTSLFIERYHGKMCAIPTNDSAFNKRDAGYGILITTTWENQNNDTENIQWAKHLYSKLSKGADIKYINYLNDPYPTKSELNQTFGKDKLRIIRDVISKYDPNNLFIKPI